MNTAFFETGPAAFLAGLAVSPHCAGMCAPLSCALAPWGGPPSDRLAFATAQHAVRLLAYTLIGALAGGIGLRWGQSLDLSPMRWLPWGLVIFYGLIAFGIGQSFPAPKFLGRLNARLMNRVRTLPAPVAGAALGAATPLIPCGPLYGMFALAFLGGSAAQGAEIAAGFALGTLPLLWAAQAGFFKLRARLGSARLVTVRRIAALLAAGVILYRILFMDIGAAFCG